MGFFLEETPPPAELGPLTLAQDPRPCHLEEGGKCGAVLGHTTP